ncbi:MAG: hypothetical protein ACR2OU_09925 [Thermomicrobiales bacterium]
MPVDEFEKKAIITVCDTFILDVLKPRFLPEIVPSTFNYPIDIFGSWAGGKYRFIQRYRSGTEEDPPFEVDSPFARLNRMGRDRFDIYWMRHTGKWWKLYTDLTLGEALQRLEEDAFLHPV